MKITKHREFTVNMGNYESMKFGASVEVDTDDLAREIGDSLIETATKHADRLLIEALRTDIARASELTGVSTSFIHTIDSDLNA